MNPKQPKEFVSLWLRHFATTHFNLAEAVSDLQQLLVVIVRRQPGGVFGPDIKQGGGTVRMAKENNFRVGGQLQLISERPFKAFLTCRIVKVYALVYCVKANVIRANMRPLLTGVLHVHF